MIMSKELARVHSHNVRNCVGQRQGHGHSHRRVQDQLSGISVSHSQDMPTMFPRALHTIRPDFLGRGSSDRSYSSAKA